MKKRTSLFSPARSTVAKRLALFMQDHDLGFEELADLLRTEPQTLAFWLSGAGKPPACALIALSVLRRPQESRIYPSRSHAEDLKRVQAI